MVLAAAVFSGPGGAAYDITGVPVDYEVKLGVDDEGKASVLGVFDLDAQYRKAQEVVLAAARSAEAGASNSSSAP